jgi:hypothetical protein
MPGDSSWPTTLSRSNVCSSSATTNQPSSVPSGVSLDWATLKLFAVITMGDDFTVGLVGHPDVNRADGRGGWRGRGRGLRRRRWRCRGDGWGAGGHQADGKPYMVRFPDALRGTVNDLDVQRQPTKVGRAGRLCAGQGFEGVEEVAKLVALGAEVGDVLRVALHHHRHALGDVEPVAL